MHLDATLITKVLHVFVDIILPIISPKDLYNLTPTLIFYQCLPNLQVFKHLILQFEEVNPTKSRGIIYENTYLDPPYDGVGNGPIKFESTNPSGCVSLLAFPFSYICSGCFPTTHLMHAPFHDLICGIPSTISSLYSSWR